MATVSEIVENSLRNFPSLYRHRTDVLHALLVGYGNGFEWDQTTGELFPMCGPYDRTDEECMRKTDQFILDGATSDNAFMREQCLQNLAEDEAENAERMRIRTNAAALTHTPGPLTDKPRQATPRYSLMFTAPANVTADWAAAIAEITEVMTPHWYNGDHIRKPQPEVVRTPEEQAAYDDQVAMVEALLAEMDLGDDILA